MRRTIELLALAASITLAACGNDSVKVQSANTGAGTEISVATPAFKNPLPAVTVRDVGAKADLNLQSLLPADKPLVIWFWAPH